jgi:fructosamine-3-kinase
MPPGSFWFALSAAWAERYRERFEILDIHPLNGGDTASCYRLDTQRGAYFVKLQRSAQDDMLSAEAEALHALAATGTLRVPTPLLHGSAEQYHYLLLELMPMRSGCAQPARLGEQLAALHRHSSDHFGWHRDNHIGASAQHNKPSDNWATFWVGQRLLPQLELARLNDSPASLLQAIEQLCAAVPALLRGHAPAPSLLHGDLWGGNVGYLQDGTPVLFDPASYFGDREADLAMTELFGGFGADFYAAYKDAWPLDEGYPLRRELYKLYHLLNHHNLFGGAYGPRALSVASDLLASLR